MKLPKKSRKNLVVISAVVTACLIGAGVYAYMATQSPDTSNTESSTPKTEVNEDQATSDEPPTGKLPDKTDSDTPTQPSTPSGNGAEEDTPSKQIEIPQIERAGQSGSSVKVVASFQKASSGDCELRLTKGRKTVTRQADIVVGPSYYTCSFVVPVSGLSSGTWQVMLQHIDGSNVANSDLQEIEVSQ